MPDLVEVHTPSTSSEPQLLGIHKSKASAPTLKIQHDAMNAATTAPKYTHPFQDREEKSLESIKFLSLFGYLYEMNGKAIKQNSPIIEMSAKIKCFTINYRRIVDCAKQAKCRGSLCLLKNLEHASL